MTSVESGMPPHIFCIYRGVSVCFMCVLHVSDTYELDCFLDTQDIFCVYVLHISVSIYCTSALYSYMYRTSESSVRSNLAVYSV